MIDLLELATQVGGLGGLVAVIVFLMYRRDRNATEKMWRESKKFTEDMLNEIIERDQESREKNTKVLTKLVTLLKLMNGKLK